MNKGRNNDYSKGKKEALKERQDRVYKLTECTKIQVLVSCNPSDSGLPPSMLVVPENDTRRKR